MLELFLKELLIHVALEVVIADTAIAAQLQSLTHVSEIKQLTITHLLKRQDYHNYIAKKKFVRSIVTPEINKRSRYHWNKSLLR